MIIKATDKIGPRVNVYDDKGNKVDYLLAIDTTKHVVLRFCPTEGMRPKTVKVSGWSYDIDNDGIRRPI